MIMVPIILVLLASFWAVDRLAKEDRDDEWRRWLAKDHLGNAPDGKAAPEYLGGLGWMDPHFKPHD